MRVTRDAAKEDRISVGTFCGPTRVWVRAVPLRGSPAHLDAKGRPLHALVEVPRAQKADAAAVADAARAGFASPAKSLEGDGPLVVRVDPGSFVLRSGGTVYLTGGAEAWDVWVDSAPETWTAPAPLWFTRYAAASETISQWPDAATRFRLLSGAANVSGHALVVGLEYPISALATVAVEGFYQVGVEL